MERWRVRRPVLLAVIAYAAMLAAVLSAITVSQDALLAVGRLLGWQSSERNPLAAARAADAVRRGANLPAGAVVILGDSILAALDPAAIGPDVHNLAVGGITARVLAELLPRLPRLSAARLIVLGVGVNDLGLRPQAEIARDYAALLDHLPASPALLVVPVLAVNAAWPVVAARPWLRNPAIAELNAQVRALCARRPGCHVLPVPEALTGADGELRDGLHAGDGWHLSAAGATLLATAIRLAMEATAH